MRAASAPARVAAAAALTWGAAACYATHEYREIRERPPLSAVPVLPARVAVAAGDLRLGRADREALYDLRMRYCRSHFVPRLAHGGEKAPSLQVGLGWRRGDVLAIPADAERNRVFLGLNPGLPVDLRLDLGSGRHVATLGGLNLTVLAVACGGGDVTIDFDEPTHGDLGRLFVDGGTGALRLTRLGNASPAGTVVRGGSGLVELDLRGAWRRDATLEVGDRLGDVLLLFPRRLAVEVRAAGRDPADLLLAGLAGNADGVHLNPGAERGSPRLSIAIGMGIGLVETRVVE